MLIVVKECLKQCIENFQLYQKKVKMKKLKKMKTERKNKKDSKAIFFIYNHFENLNFYKSSFENLPYLKLNGQIQAPISLLPLSCLK